MKSGRHDYYIPFPTTVSQDIKRVFVTVQADGKDAAGMCISHFNILQADNETYLKEHEGELIFVTDAWTSPNHKAFIAVIVHFENNGEPMCMLLDPWWKSLKCTPVLLLQHVHEGP